MSTFIHHDLHCSVCNEDEDVLYRVSSGIPDCSHCNAPRTITWTSGKAPCAHVFGELDLGYTKVYSQAELNVEVARIEARHPGQHVEINGEDMHKAKRSAEFHFHRAHEKRKATGLDERIVKEHREAREVVANEAAEKALRNNLAPEPAANKARNDFGSPARAVGGSGQ